MKKKFLIGSIIAAAIILLATFTPAIVAKDIETEKMVTIKTTYYKFLHKEEIINEVTEEEAQQIMEILEEYRQSITKEDKKSIEKFESILIDKGIISEDYISINKKDIKFEIFEKFISMKLKNSPTPSADNRMCTVTARGKGNLSYMFEDAFDSFLAGAVVLLLLCAIFPPLAVALGLPALLLLFSGFAGLIITHLIPLRILYPKINMDLKTGDLSINGLNGSQEFPAPVTADFYWFSGLTINLFTPNPDLFLMGFAFRSEVL